MLDMIKRFKVENKRKDEVIERLKNDVNKKNSEIRDINVISLSKEAEFRETILTLEERLNDNKQYIDECLVDLKHEKNLNKGLCKFAASVLTESIQGVMTLDNSGFIYKLLKNYDKEGWCLYGVSKDLMPGNIYDHFYYEDNCGRFDESNGYELFHYRCIMHFSECTYDFVGMYEKMTDYSNYTETEEYQKVLKQLYHDTTLKIIEEYIQDIVVNEPDIIDKIKSIKIECMAI